ncbi:MAG: tetratricopeptide repeat protein [bacterium]|nr:tetratricopeptide repeat protein [bacterium]
MAYYSKKKFDDAIEEYQMAIHENSKMTKAHFGLGVAFIHTGFFRGAVLALTEALTLEPNFPEADFNLGIAHFHLKQHDKALTHLESAYAQNPNLQNLHFFLAQTYEALSRPDRALSSYKQALQTDADLRTHRALAALYRRRNDPQNAIKHYRAAVAVDTTNYEIRYELGVLYESQDDPTHAARTFRKALVLRPDNLALGFRLSDLLIRLQAFQDAVDLYNTILLKHHQTAQIYFNLGTLYDHLGDPTNAIQSYRQTTRLDPHFSNAHLNMAIDLLQQKQFKEALLAYEKFLETARDEATRNQVQQIVTRLRTALALPE